MDLVDRLNKNDYTTFFKFIKLTDNFEELWKLKTTARQVLRDWLRSMSFERDISELVSNASCELMENIIKFSKADESAFIVVEVFDQSSISIDTYNKSELFFREKLISFLDGLHKEQKQIEDLYLDRLREAVFSTESRLGIIKILLETGGRVELVDEEDEEMVHIRFMVDVNKSAPAV